MSATTQSTLKGAAHLSSLRNSSYINLRALMLGGGIGYGYWYVAHHADQFAYVLAAILTIVIFGTIWTSHITFQKIYRANYLILPSILLVSSLFFFLLLKNPSYQFLFIIIVGGIYAYYFRSLAELRERPSPERKKSFTQSLDIVSILVAFFSFATLQELLFFFSWHATWIILLGTAVSMTLLYQNYWYHRVITLRAHFYVLLGGLIMVETLWAISFLPTGYLANAVLSVAALYAYQSLTVTALRGLLKKRTVIESIAMAGVISVIVLVSSRWTPLV